MLGFSEIDDDTYSKVYPIGCGARHELGGNDTVGTDTIINNSRLTEKTVHLARHHTGINISGAACGKRNDQPQRALREILRPRGC